MPDPEFVLVVVALISSVVGFAVGSAVGGARKRNELARSGALGGDDCMDAMLEELQELCSHVADLTLMVDDSRPTIGGTDAVRVGRPVTE